MKVTIYELLGMVKDGKAPKKIMYNNETFTLREEKDDYANQNHWFTDRVCLLDLNKEVEIIEEDKKIRKITLLGEEIKLGSLSNWLKDFTNNEEKIASCIECNAMKINEIIDKLEENK